MTLKKKRIFLNLLLCLLVAIGIIISEEEAEAATARDYYTEIDKQGSPLSGTILETQKRVFRPAYMGSWGSALQDITDEFGKPYFEKFNKGRQYKKGDIIFYNNVGYLEGRKLSIKMAILRPDSPHWISSISLKEDGSMFQEITSAVKDPHTTIQLVYTDTKEVVPNIYVEFPQRIQMSSGYNPNTNVMSTMFYKTEGLKKVYLQIPEWVLKAPIALEDFGTEPKENLAITVSKYFDNTVLQDYVVIFDNDYPMEATIRSVTAYTSGYHLFASAIESPRVPSYSMPNIVGRKSENQFKVEYEIDQSVTSTYDQYYPESVTIVLEDQKQFIRKLSKDAISVFDKDSKEITDKVTIKPVGDQQLHITISKDQLKALKTNAIKLKVSFSDLELNKVLSLFDETTKSYKLPLSVYNIREKENQKITSDKNSAEAEIIPNIAAEAIHQNVEVGSSTAELNPQQLVKNLTSTIPEDTVKVLGFKQEVVFDKAGKHEVGVNIASSKTPGLTAIVTIPVTANETVVTSDIFDNQAWIIDEINRLSSPKKIDKDLVFSDVYKITKLELPAAKKFAGQYIPKGIKHLINVTSIVLTEKNMIGSLPTELSELKQLTNLNITGNQFDGVIPTSFNQLLKLTNLLLNDNRLTGTVPNELFLLPQLKILNIANNQLIGQVPVTVGSQLKTIDIANNQLTYNGEQIPTYLTGNNYQETFIGQQNNLKLDGTEYLTKASQLSTIKPFDSENAGYFGLAAKNMKTGKQVDLYGEHLYEIINTQTKELLYKGTWDKKVTIPYRFDIEYEVIMDGASGNRNNKVSIKGILPELKLANIPEKMNFKVELSDYSAKEVQLTGKLAVYDNREGGNWQLNVIIGKLMSQKRELKGRFSYINEQEQEIELVSGQKNSLIKGNGDIKNPITTVSNNWTGKKGLRYRMDGSNYLGNYQGDITWVLEDVPNPK